MAPRTAGPGVGAGGPVVGFAVPSRDEVDRRYAALAAAGNAGRQEPYAAFWGGRFAMIADPDGHECGLVSLADPGRAYVPE